MLSQLMDSSPEGTAAIFLSPTFTYKSGTLFAEEYNLLKGFNDQGVHVDLQCQLVYDPKSKSETCLLVCIQCFGLCFGKPKTLMFFTMYHFDSSVSSA